MMRSSNYGLAAATALLAVSLALSAVRTADACATFGPLRAPRSAPSPALERVLIVHDPVARKQHFIREVVFAGDAKSFGFVVPTPSKPEVFPVTDPPFDRLEHAFPFAPPPKTRERSAESARSARGTLLSAAMPVEVVEQKAVGSFTAFLLRANDASALASWLRDNQLGSTAENDAWLASYVARDFYFVAMRYEPSKRVSGKVLASETISISFESPLAYYPYEEPRRAKPTTAGRRALAIWLVAPEQLVPVAFERRDDGGRWLRPLQAGQRTDAIDGQGVRSHLGFGVTRFVDSKGRFVVHTFEDQKQLRDGLGEVVFLPAAGVAPAARAEVAAFVARVCGRNADFEPLLAGDTALRSLPLYATQRGQRFDPKLRAKLAPKQVIHSARRHELADDF